MHGDINTAQLILDRMGNVFFDQAYCEKTGSAVVVAREKDPSMFHPVLAVAKSDTGFTKQDKMENARLEAESAAIDRIVKGFTG